ncbi:acyl--CoA ligase [Verticiella sediminum]|uniref:Acyl--CoA ligase n=1 Tax=Verticiella sediminum TaxID=1247510 RepID=A0A556AMV6_9BURK|nr:class I adenylate-forming enzyme family protein [Verticiella sediminum]TSH94222.1 acyl--CoA ligase [Verticiella sediminum]
MTGPAFPESSNLGGMIAELPDDHPWLIEVAPDGSERRFGYGELRRYAAAVARSVQARGLPAGSRIGLVGLNSAQYLLTYYGIMQAGYCAVPIGYKLALESVEYVLGDAGVALVYADADWAGRLAGKVDTLPLGDGRAWAASLSFGAFEAAEVPPDEPATILYTSGSTGVPKGVPLTHGGYIWTLRAVAANGGEFMREHQARVLTAAPLSHMNALFLAKTVTAYGGTLVLMTQFNARAFLEAAARHRCSIVTGVPTMFALCARETDLLEQLDLASVQSVAMGSAPVSDALFEQVRAMFPFAVVQNGWGTTETGPAVFGPHPDGLPRPPLALGHPLPGVQVRLEGGSPDEGELYVRNGAIMPGYLNRDDETRKRLVDGWYKTGDVMRRDAHGFYYFVGRADDMFVCGGENMYPGEIELLLEKHPGVAQAAVVPVPDEIKGQIPAAFIVRKPGSSVTEDEIKAYALANGPVYQHPRFVRFIDEMPLSAANKIDKKRIKELAAGLGR